MKDEIYAPITEWGTVNEPSPNRKFHTYLEWCYDEAARIGSSARVDIRNTYCETQCRVSRLANEVFVVEDE